jgi:hypothetical protein
MRLLLTALVVLSTCATAACTGPTTPPPNTPPNPDARPPAPALQLTKVGPESFTIDGPLREEWMPLLKMPAVDAQKVRLSTAPPGLPPAPATCDAFASRKGAAPPSCGDAATAFAALDAALASDDAAKRDALLVSLEACAGLPAGAVRAIRAELAPIECGEAIVTPVVTTPPAGMGGHMYLALLGQAVASRLSRAATSPPKLAAPYTRTRVREFTDGPMKTWFTEQALLIQQLSQEAVELPAYAKGITAIEAGVAEMRLVEAVRSAPLPNELAKDPELQTQYYGTLDQALDPRKDRGRDAALVGLRELALVGAIRDARVDRARSLLSRLYGGRRIDALDALLLPPLPKAQPTSVEERLAGKLPTYYAGILLDEQAATRAGTLRMFLEKGIPLPQRNALRAATLTPDARALLARGRLALGQLYWRTVDFDQAAALTSKWPDGAAPPDEVRLYLALAIALRGGPDDAHDMMRKAPLALSSIGKVGALDFIAQEKPPGPNAGIAAFDAAILRQITAPEGASASYFREVAERFRLAASLLTAPAERALAEDRAKAAEQLAAAIK